MAVSKNVKVIACSLLSLYSVVSLALPVHAQANSLSGEAKQTQLQGNAEEKVQSLPPLEGKLEQTALNSILDNQNAIDSRKPLEGRLEQIALPDAKLPIELTTSVNKLKAFADIQLIQETPRLDVMPKPTLLTANLTKLSTMTSFPDFLVGTWGGHLKISTRKIYIPHITDARLAVDELGTIVVRFVKEEDNISVIPPSVFFQPRIEDRLHHIMRREGNPDAKEDLRAEEYNDYPVIGMGSKHWHDALGGQWQDDVVHHSLQRIGDNSAEQDTVFKRANDGAPYGYRETVARYTWKNKTRIFMQAAIVDYTMDRHVRKRTTMEGFIVPEWHPFANEVASFTALPWTQIVKIYDLKIDW